MKTMKNLLMPLAALLMAATMFTSCSKDDETPDYGNPVITLKADSGYTSQNVTVLYSDTLMVGLKFQSNGSDNLTNFKISVNGEAVKDSTITGPGAEFDFYIIKQLPATESWKFDVTDAAGHTVSKTLVISRENGINAYAGVVLGAQNNTTDKGFMSASTGATFTIDEAFNNQEIIDLFCFYEDTPSHQNFMTLAAPGSNIQGIFTGDHDPANYTTKNKTFFVKTTLTTADFDGASTDDLMLTNFDNENKFKKASKLEAGTVYVLQFANSKYGILKVVAVEGTEDGKLTFDLKVQK